MKKTKFKENLSRAIKEIGNGSKIRGITLISLIVTIIILLILAGIAIGTLKNSNLFESAKKAKEKYQIAKQDEENNLDEYSNQIDLATSRDTIEIPTDVYNALIGQISTNTNVAKVSINKPNTWVTGTEYSFGNGTYGRRFTGTNIPAWGTYGIIGYFKGNGLAVFDFGGWYDPTGNTGVKKYINSTYNLYETYEGDIVKDLDFRISIINLKISNEEYMRIFTNISGNYSYDIWILYTKSN